MDLLPTPRVRWVVLTVLMTLACGGATLRPQRELEGTAQPLGASELVWPKPGPMAWQKRTLEPAEVGTRVAVVAVHDVPGALTFELRVSPLTLEPAQASLRGPFAEPCALGNALPRARVSGSSTPGRWLASFPLNDTTRMLMDSNAFLDVEIRPSGQCVRVAVGGYVADYRLKSTTWLLTAGMTLDIPETNVNHMGAALAAPIGLAKWFGGVRGQLTLAPLGTVECAPELCGGSDEDPKWGRFYSASLEAGVLPLIGETPAGFLGSMYWGGRYTVGFGELPGLEGTTTAWRQMVQVILALSYTPNTGRSLKAAAGKGGGTQMGIPFGFAFAQQGDGLSSGWVLGYEWKIFLAP